MGRDLKGRRAVVTGGASGIGLASATRLADEGAAVAVLDLRADAAVEAAERIAARGGMAMALQCDVSEEASVHDAVGRAASWMGGVDALVACAGIARAAETHLAPLAIRLVTAASGHCACLVGSADRPPSSAHPLNLRASAQESWPRTCSRTACGSTARHRALRGPSSRVTPPFERGAAPEEIASVVAFLCSDDSSFMTGAAVPVDGGYSTV